MFWVWFLENQGDIRDLGLIPGLGVDSREGNDYPLQYSCLENSMDRGDWWASVHGVTKSQTWLSSHAHMHTFLMDNAYSNQSDSDVFAAMDMATCIGI